MCEGFSNKKEGNSEREKRRYGENVATSPIPRFLDSGNQGHYRGVGRG